MRAARIFLLFTAAYFLSYFFRSANAVIAPDLAAELHLGAAQLGLMTSLFYAAFAAVQIPLGVALDRYGARLATPGLMLAAVAGSLLFAAAPGFGALAAGRALIGAGMAGVLMGSLKIFSRWFPAGRYATVSGLLVGLGSLGALAAATPLAWLNQVMGWRGVFGIGAAATAVSAAAILLFSRNAPPDARAETAAPPANLRTLLANLRTVFTDRRLWRIIPVNFFFAGTLLAFQGLWAGPYLFDVLRLTDIQAGNVLLVLGGGATAGYLASGWLCDRFGISRMLALAVAGFVACQLLLAVRPPQGLVVVVYAVLGFTGGFNVMLLAQARRLFPLHLTGQAVTAVNLFGIGGTFVLQWWLGILIGAFPPDAAGHYPPRAYTAALAFTAVGGLLSLLWYLPLAAREAAA
ncbi:MAG: MFS transporter [Anaerolineales bacterium]|nr:MFS transporter [Anaerolineales bacterium]